MTAQADALMGIFGYKRVEGEMKTDRELLELAAKAAGYQVRWHENWQCFVHVNPHNIDNPPTPAGKRLIWAPLTDDGDALRLAVALRMDLNINDGECDVFTADSFYNGRGEDTLETTRRAIVRAAAAIGEQMQ